MRKEMKKVVLGALACAMLLSASTVSYAKNDKGNGKNQVTTEATTEATTETTETTTEAVAECPVAPEAQKVSKVTCTAAGKVNVSFKGSVTYSCRFWSCKGTEIHNQNRRCKCKGIG